MVTPRLDAVEEVTVTGAVPTADQAALGAVNIAFVTRSGTNNFDGSLYHYFRDPHLNSNYYLRSRRPHRAADMEGELVRLATVDSRQSSVDSHESAAQSAVGSRQSAVTVDSRRLVPPALRLKTETDDCRLTTDD
jgi:hypothetical protein